MYLMASTETRTIRTNPKGRDISVADGQISNRCTGDLGAVGSEIKVNSSVPVIQVVELNRSAEEFVG